MESFLELVKSRYSVRNFLPNPVEEEKLMQIVEAARIAPSAANFQPWHFIVVQEENQKMALCSCYRGEWLKKAPVIIVVAGSHSISWKREDGKDHCDIDIAIATDHMTLMAASLGLGTCWVCHFDSKKCADVMALPRHIEPMVLLPLGYPLNSTIPEIHFNRKKMEEILHFNKF
ncbi:MAG: nitroreductase family protein [Lentimicrobiaceae bacterium]|nr:nitroreductase family protein [Lentimicrobiaceae bacterium]